MTAPDPETIARLYTIRAALDPPVTEFDDDPDGDDSEPDSPVRISTIVPDLLEHLTAARDLLHPFTVPHGTNQRDTYRDLFLTGLYESLDVHVLQLQHLVRAILPERL